MRHLVLLLVLVVALSLHAAEAAPKRPPPKRAPAKKSPPRKSPPKRPKGPPRPPPTGKLSCNLNCLSRNRAIVPKTAAYQLANASTSVDCLRNAYAAKKGFIFYQWVPQRGTCYGFKDCANTKQNTAVLAGRMNKCPRLKWPPPPPPVPTYCSAQFSGKCFRRCPRPTRCETRENGKRACCCPPTAPNPVIKRGRLKGCTK